jgi:methyl-accepting chemotaxis protein
MTLRGRITLLSATLVLLGAGAGTLAVLVMRAMNSSFQNVSQNSLPAIYLLGRVDSIAKDARGKMRSHCVSLDAREMAQIQAETLKLDTGFESEMQAYEKFTVLPEEARLQNGVMDAKKEFYRRWAKIQTVSAAGQKGPAMKQFLAEAMPGFEKLQKSIAVLSAYKKMEADHNIVDAATAARRGQIGVAVMMALVMICGAALSWMLVRWVQHTVGRITNELGRAAQQLMKTAGEVAESNTHVSDACISQGASIEETWAASTQVSATVQANSKSCTALAECLTRVEGEMSDGGKAMQALGESIAAIVRSSKSITNVLKTIDGIAFQTNILALNAAVEAARAGEAGLSFAVVADEVRGLSTRCAEAASQTREFLEESMRNAHEGELRVTHAADVIRAAGEDVTRARELGGSVNAGSAEQVLGVSQIASALGGLEQINQQNADEAARTSLASIQLDKEAKGLQTIVGELQNIAGQ